MEITKAVLLKEKKSLEWVAIPGGMESTDQVAQKALKLVTEKAGISVNDISSIKATGVGSQYVSFTHDNLPEFLCLARGIDYLLPSVKVLLDLGARKSLAMRCSRGKATKLAASSKCAAGTGTYLKMVADLFHINTDEMSDLSFKSKSNLEIQTTCAVFAESEIISLIHGGAKPEDIMRAVFRGLAGRIYPQLLEIGIEKDVAVVGGFATNKALKAALEEALGFEILVPENPGVVSALGAALTGQEKRSGVK
jgi:predicted CoA-substrate-specific enzyme activase